VAAIFISIIPAAILAFSLLIFLGGHPARPIGVGRTCSHGTHGSRLLPSGFTLKDVRHRLNVDSIGIQRLYDLANHALVSFNSRKIVVISARENDGSGL
jgi:hypothetical protein